MSHKQTQSYLVRIWQDGSVWRARVTHVGSNKHHFFTSLGQLCLFWQEETAVPPTTSHLQRKESNNHES